MTTETQKPVPSDLRVEFSTTQRRFIEMARKRGEVLQNRAAEITREYHAKINRLSDGPIKGRAKSR